mgnify:CR=1 FL=1
MSIALGVVALPNAKASKVCMWSPDLWENLFNLYSHLKVFFNLCFLKDEESANAMMILRVTKRNPIGYGHKWDEATVTRMKGFILLDELAE